MTAESALREGQSEAEPDRPTSMAAEEVAVVEVRSREAIRHDPLYTGRVQVYPKRVKGTFRNIKWAALAALLAIYYLVPWIRWDRGPGAPDQAILIDMPGRRAYFFWIEIWPQEVYFLTGLLIIGALGLFFVTALFGRVWCGYACPQTVWTDLYMWVERRIEGDRNARIKLDRAPWTRDKLLRKGAKHGVWLLIAALTGGAWIMYFNDAPSVTADILTGEASFGVYFFFGLFTATTYLLAGWAREQVCTYMCPWPRFQAALTDEDSLVVTYQGWRGEPRGKHKKGDSWEGRGDCIACNNCVAVCPTGIDIRDGYQLECIGCGLCIDACNNVMAKVGRPANLITLDSERNQAFRSKGEEAKAGLRLIRPRTIGYALILAAVGGLVLFGLLSRSRTEIDVLHDRNPLFVTLSNGDLRNGYTVKILNKTQEPQTYDLEVIEPAQATLKVIGQQAEELEEAQLTAAPDSVASYKLYLRLPRQAVEEESLPVTFHLLPHGGGRPVVAESIFRGPSS
jgi:cytochrome c oxidase accessory protein FixG